MYCENCQRLFVDQARNPLLFPSVVDLLSDKGYEFRRVVSDGCSMCQKLRQLEHIEVLKAFTEEGRFTLLASLAVVT